MINRQVVLLIGRLASLLILSAVFLVPAVLRAQEKPACTLPDCDEAKTFFIKFQKAIDANRRQDVADLLNYPFYSYRDGKTTAVKNKAELPAQYDNIFARGTVCAITAATVGDVWGNWRGFTVNAGVVWWTRIIPNSVKRKGAIQPADLSKYPFGVITVNHSPETEKSCAATSIPNPK